MDHSCVPVLPAVQELRRRGDVVYGPPGHKQGRGTDPRVRELLGEGMVSADILTLNGLEDRRGSQGVLTQAQGPGMLIPDAADGTRKALRVVAG